MHAVLVVDPGADPDAVVRAANAAARRSPEDPARAGLARAGAAAHRRHAQAEARRDPRLGAERRRAAAGTSAGGDALAALVAKYAGRDDVAPSDDDRRARAELARTRRADGGARGRVSDAHRRGRVRRAREASRELRDARRARRRRATRAPAEPVEFPSWNRSWPARAVRRVSLPTWILPLARVFAWIRVEGREHLDAHRRPGDLRRQPSEPHGHAGDPGGAAARGCATASRRRWPRNSSRRTSFRSSTDATAWFTNSLNYYLAALFFNAFPLPQREAGARQTLRYIGEVLEDGFSVLIFPEGKRTDTRRDRPIPAGHRHDCVAARRAGRARSESRGSTRCSTTRGGWPKPGRVRVAFGAPLRLTGDDYEALAETGGGGGQRTL